MILVNPKLQRILYWKDSSEGIIFICVAENYEDNLLADSEEGKLKWIELDKLKNIMQFDQNSKFTPFLFINELFEGKFLLDDDCKVLEYKIRKI